MKRVHTVEFEDLSWFPSWLRTCMTNLLRVMSRLMGIPDALGAVVTRVMHKHKLTQIVDLGSGSGGVMPEVIEQVRAQPETAHATLLLTDLYPNQEAIKQFSALDEHVLYLHDPVDATDFTNAPEGLKTMINCFHHMRPEMARKILQSAHDQRQPLLIYEMAENNIPFLVWLLFLPLGLLITFLMALVLTLFVRPITFKQLFFTYAIPLIPIFYAWDGQNSLPRIYSYDDLDQLLHGLDDDGYTWEKGPAIRSDGKKVGYYLLGTPHQP